MTCALVLAAGLSRRMGPGVQKLLLPFAGTTVIGHVIGQVLAAPVERTIVVVGPDPQVAETVAAYPVTVVTNARPDADMLDSARCGLRVLPKGCNAVLLVLGDQPSVTTALILQIIQTFATCGLGIVVPAHQGRRGHPLLFAAHYATEVLRGYDGVGVRGLLRSHPADVFELECGDPSIAADVDVPEDYQRELARSAEAPASARPVRE